MAKRYEISDASWELIKGLVLQGRKWVDHAVMIVWFMESFESCGRALPGVTCRHDLGVSAFS